MLKNKVRFSFLSRRYCIEQYRTVAQKSLSFLLKDAVNYTPYDEPVIAASIDMNDEWTGYNIISQKIHGY